MPPSTLYCPGTVSWAIQKRFSPSQGKCGLTRTMPSALAVSRDPMAMPLEPFAEPLSPVSWLLSAATSGLRTAPPLVGPPAGAFPLAGLAGGVALTSLPINESLELATIWRERRNMSVTVMGRAQGLPAQFGSFSCPEAR